MKRNSPHTNKKNKPSTAEKTQLSLIASHRQHVRARFKFGILNSAPSWTKCLTCRCGSSKSSLRAFWVLNSRKFKVQNVCMCTSVFFCKHAPCHSTFVVVQISLWHLAWQCANVLCCFISPFVLWVLSVSACCIVVNYVWYCHNSAWIQARVI